MNRTRNSLETNEAIEGGSRSQWMQKTKGRCPEIADVPFRYAFVPIMGFPVHFPFAAPRDFRWLFSSHFRMQFSDLDKGEAVGCRLPADRSATPRTVIA